MAHSSFFVTDLHGHPDRYEKLFAAVRSEGPAAVFLGGDLFPHGHGSWPGGGGHDLDFLDHILRPGFEELKATLCDRYPDVFLILGNDDGRALEARVREGDLRGLWHYAHEKWMPFGRYVVLGYSCVPPTPFRLKDWERYDVSRYVDPGCISPEEGYLSVPHDEDDRRYGTIQKDLDRMAGGVAMDSAICLFHVPPYRTNLDRAALDGQAIEGVPLDPHVGSIAVRRFLEARGPRISLHGHVHESARLTGSWQDRVGRTYAFSAAHDGPELALVRFDPEDPEAATRELL